MITALLATFLAFAPTAHAAACDAPIAAARAASGPALLAAFDKVAACDKGAARSVFLELMRKAGDVETLAPLALRVLEADGFNQAWEMMDKLPYDVRAPLAQAVGEACTTRPAVGTFLRASHSGLRGTAFVAWEPAYLACTDPALLGWLEGLVTTPPTSTYDDKYNAVVAIYRRHKKADALPALEAAAVKAGTQGGPFTGLLEAMARAIEPDFGRAADPAQKLAMEEAMVRVAKAVPPASARVVADRLFTVGAEGLAASLLPTIYPDRVGGDGTLMWGAAALEVCDKETVVHWATFRRLPDRWQVTEVATAPMRAVKAKLKCAPAAPWNVVTTDAPLATADEAEAWAEGLAEAARAKGQTASITQEKKVVVP